MDKYQLPWLSLTCHGFSDAPLSSSGREHGFGSNGDDLLTLVLFPDNSHWIFRAFGTNDIIS